MKSNFRYLDRDQFIENVIGHAIQANKLTWTTLRYSVAHVDFLFKPILTKMNLEQSSEGLEFTFDKEDVLEESVPKVMTSKEVLDENLLNMISFSFLVPIGGVPTVSFAHILFGKQVGIVSCFFTTREGCKYLNKTISEIDVSGNIAEAINTYVDMEKAVDCLEKCDKGFMNITSDSEFRIYDHNNEEGFVTLAELDRMIKSGEEFDKTDSDKEDSEDLIEEVEETEEDSEGDVWI